jgi:hypothetical protein
MQAKNILRLVLLVITLFTFKTNYAQIGGGAVYRFINLEPSARAAAMGGSVISLADVDLATAQMNPATLSKTHHNNLSMNFNNYFKDISYGYLSYAKKFSDKKNAPIFSSQIMYMNYGQFDGYDPTGVFTGKFNASDMLIAFSAAKPVNDKFSYGGSFKFIYSILEAYVGTGVAFDMGGFYNDTAKNLSMGLVFKNAGYQTIAYRNTERAPLPFEIQFAISKKPKNAPFRLTMLLHNLQKPDLTYSYIDPQNRKINDRGEFVDQEISFASKAFRHVTGNVEIILSENFQIRGGYNHQRRRELGTAVRMGVAGFSWGCSFKIKKIRLEYGSAAFFPGYNSNMFSVNLNLNEFYR